MPRKVFQCKACGDQHERPINSKCQYVKESDSSDVDNESSSSAGQMDINKQILQELKQLNGRIAKVEERVDNQEKGHCVSHKSVKSVSTTESASSQDDAELMLPSLSSLKSSRQLQSQVDQRLQELQAINMQGKFKSQRGGSNETVYCKREVPWPHNFILSGSSKSRISYDNLSMSQWVSGFGAIIREESNIETKNQMLEYLSDLMDDSHDFGWQSAKAAHAVLLCKMEENTVEWSETTKIDRVHRVHAQRVVNSSNKRLVNKDKPLPCRYYQKGTCGQKGDHENNGQSYLHVCSVCFSFGKSHAHPQKECKRSKNDQGTA